MAEGTELPLIAEVALDVPGHDCFSYLVPEVLAASLGPGDQVRVPLGRRSVDGFVVHVGAREAPQGYTLRAIVSCPGHCRVPRPLVRLLQWCARYYRCSLGQCFKAAVPGAVRQATKLQMERRVARVPGFLGKVTVRQRAVLALVPELGDVSTGELARRAGCTPGVINRLVAQGALQIVEQALAQELRLQAQAENHRLTDEQEQAYQAVAGDLERGGFQPSVLYGVTGSGKTLVYMALVERVIAQGRQALLLLPEIALTPQLSARFRARFSRVVVWHSAFSDGERHSAWQQVAQGKVDLVVGTRSALFAPFPDLGLIIVDEEHDGSYKQESVPRYHGRDVAVVYASQLGIPVLLGTATPSAETLYNARQGRYRVLTLKQRPAGGKLPTPELVDMREECKRQGRLVVLSQLLVQRLQEARARNEQAIVLLNRRGWSPSAQCRHCGTPLKCQHCAVGLTYHKASDLLRCHWCGFAKALPAFCPTCQEPGISLAGVGTEQLQQLLEQAVPGLRVLRLDADTVGEKQGHAKVLARFSADNFDCLLGTQMVAKGLNFPRVTVVGVIAADHGLSQPDFRAAERTWQLISQVAGRAGRGDRPGTVVVQAFDPHAAAIQCALYAKAKRFFDGELQVRQLYGYPPFSGLVRFLWRGKQLAQVETLAQAHCERIRPCLDAAVLLDPVPATVPWLKGQHRYHALLKASSRAAAQAILDRVQAAGGLPEQGGVQVVVDVDPLSFA